MMEIFITALSSSALVYVDTDVQFCTYTHTASADEGCCVILYYQASAAFRGKYLFVGSFSSSLVSKTAHIPGRDRLPVLLNIIKQTCRYCSNLSAASQFLNLQNVRPNPVQITPQDSSSSPCSVETFQ